MRQFVFSVITAVSVLSSSLAATPTVIQSVDPSQSAWVIPYTKYRLNNGLTVVIHEDHSDPMVHVEVMYHVGSAREEVGKSGFAHLFEHMMFQGSKHVPYNAHFRIITEAGGKMNGSAARDRTNYYETVPKNQLETVMWLESDRMGYFLDGISQEKFEIQRATVKNEKAQRYDNRPYGLGGEYLHKLHYPYGHPYSWETIGNVPDLDRVTAEDLKLFFKQWYSPNNAVLVIAGDVDSAQTIAMVDRYFAAIPAGPPVPPAGAWVPTLSQNRYVSYEDPLVELPQITMVFPTPQRHHPDEPALDCLAMILGTGPNSLLYQALVKTQLAVDVEAYNYTSELAGEFVITVTPYAGTPLAKIEAAVNQVLVSFNAQGASIDDVDRFRARYEMGVMQQLQSVEEKSGILASNELMTGNPGFLQEESSRYRGVTSEMVWDVYSRYISHRSMSVLSILPKGQGALRAAADTIANPSMIPSYSVVADTLDRRHAPTPDSAPTPPALPIWDITTGNTRVSGIVDTSNEMVKVQLRFPGGAALAVQLGYPHGSAQFLAAMMMQDTQGMSLETLNAALEKLGSSISIGAGQDDMSVSIQSLQSHWAETMLLVKQRLFLPAFSAVDFDRIKVQTLEGIKAAKADSDHIADVVVMTQIYGKAHPLVGAIGGNTESISKISILGLQSLYPELFAGDGLSVAVVGALSQDDVRRSIKDIQFALKGHQLITTSPLKPSEPTHIVLVDLPGATQSELRIVMPGPSYDVTGNFYVSQLFNFPIGGNFNSRLNMQLREVRGISYGAYSYFQASAFPGYFEASSSVKGGATGMAVKDCIDILNKVVESGISESDTAYMKNAVLQREALRYETFDQKLDLVSRIQRYHLPDDFLIERAAVVRRISTSELNQVGQKMFHQPMIIIIVGDAKLVRPQLDGIGLPITDASVEDFIW